MKSKDFNSRRFISYEPEVLVKSSISRTNLKSDKLFQKTFWSLALMCLMLFSNSGKAQMSTYTFAQTAGTYAAVSGGTSLVAGAVDSGASGVTSIGFNFVLDGTTHTQFSVSSNGWMRLGAAAATTASSPMASLWPCLAPYARDGKTNGAVVYAVTGSAPNRVLTVEWPNWYPQWNSTTTTLTMQVKLYETTNVVEFVYGPRTVAATYTGQTGIGIGTTNYSNRTSTTSWSASAAGTGNTNSMTISTTVGPASGQTYSWTPPPAPTITSFTPTSGCPGATLTINGTNLTQIGTTASKILVGGTAVASVTSNSGTQIVATLGGGTTGTVQLNGTGAIVTSASSFTFSSPPVPTTPSTNNNTSTSFSANWGASAGATSYILDVSTSNTFATFLTGFNGLDVGNVTTYSVTGLTAGTTYYWRVRALSACASGNTAMQTVATAYCTASGTSTTYFINGVTTTGAVTNLANTSVSNAGGYGNFTAQSASNTLGSATTITVTHSATGGGAGVAIFIDWNKDFDFADANETIGSSNAYNYSPYSSTINVPAGTAAGSYRMRVVIDYNSTNPSSCPSAISGETEDYTFTVVPNCSGTPNVPTATASAASACFGNQLTLTAAGATQEGGISNNWQIATTSGGPYSNITGATAATYLTSATLPVGTYYFVNRSTCSFSSTSSTSNELQIDINGAAAAFSMSPASYCGTGGTSTLTATDIPGATYAWASNGGTLSSTSGSSITADLTATTDFQLSVTKNGCTATTTKSIGVYSFPAITPTATPSTLCAGTTATLATGLSAGNFAAICIPANIRTVPTGAGPYNTAPVALVTNGVVTTPQTTVSTDDGGWGPINLGFSFNFFGTAYTTVNLGTNGTLQFGAYNGSTSGGVGDYTIGALPNVNDPRPAIFLASHDMAVNQTPSNIRYWTEGAAPNRKFILDFNVTTLSNATALVQMQAILFETTGQIEVIAKNVTATASKVIGVNGPTGLIGAAAPNCATNAANYWNSQTATITTPTAWKFIPPVNYAFNWSVNGTANPATDQLNGTSYTTTSITQTPSATTAYQVYIQDPITNCSSVFQTPVTVIQTPPAPTATDWTQCGTQIPQASVSCPTCSGSEVFNWYTAATNGTLFQGKISENFNQGTTSGTLYGNASVTGARCVLTPGTASQNGAILLGSTGVNSNAYNIDFDFQVGPSDAAGYNGADGMSYSFGDDVNAVATVPNAENGSGSKLKVGFVTYTNGSSTAGIYLMYNCTTDEQTPTTTGVLAYSANMSWKNTSSPVHFNISINAAGQLTLSLDGTALFSNVQLPSSYLLEDKSSWKQLFKARTGAGWSLHAIDNMVVEAQPAQAFTSIQQPVSTSATYYVQTIDGICPSSTLSPVNITVNPAATLGITSNFSACVDAVYPITVTTGLADYTNFTWSPAALLYSDAAGTTQYVAGTNATTVYFKSSIVGPNPAIVCTAVDGGVGSLQCANSASVNITTVANPVAPVITASATSVCTNGTVTVSIPAPSAYAASAATSTADEDITNVTFGTLNNTSTCSTTGGTGSSLNLYSNYTAVTAPNITAGVATNFSVTVGTCGGWYSPYVSIYIDYNKDGDFGDAGESAYASASITAAGAVTGTITVPTSALNGNTRMRVVMNESAPSATGTYTYGETEDYTINITGGASLSYTWSPNVFGGSTASSVTSSALTSDITVTAVLNDGTCNSSASNSIAVTVGGTPTISAAVAAASGAYSIPTVSSPTSDEDIDRVRIQQNGTTIFNNVGTVNSLSTTLNPGGIAATATGTAGGYSNFTSYGPFTLDASVPVDALVRTTNTGTAYGNACAIFMDYNQNGSFADAGEMVYAATTTTSGPHAETTTFTIPATAKNGITRMRVVCNEGTIASAATAVYYGEYEDYAINITNASPATPCPGSTFNLTSTAANGGQPYTYAWTVVSGTATISDAAIANPTAIVTEDAVFSVTLTDACGVVVSATTTTADVLENTITVTPAAITVCGNPGTTFTAAGGSNYSWTPATQAAALNTTTGASVIASPTATTTYTVTGTFGANCTGTATAVLTYTAPAFSVTVNNASPVLCATAGTVNLEAVPSIAGAYNYSWSGASAATLSGTTSAAVTATIPTSAVATSYVYEVTVDDGAGCSVKAPAGISFFTFTPFNATANASTSPSNVCEGSTVTLDAGVSTTNFNVQCLTAPTALSTRPQNANYLFQNGALGAGVVAGSYVAPPNSNVVTSYSTSMDDNYVGNVPVGFSFNYFGATVTKVFVGTNGTINLGTTGSTQFNFAGGFPNTGNPASTIAVCARDLYATAGSISYWTEGIAPTRRFIVQYDGIPNYTGGGVENAEVIMYESTGIVEINVISATNGTATAGSSSSTKYIGLQDGTQAIGATATNCTTNTLNYWNGVDDEITTPKAWRFNPPVNYTFAWTAIPTSAITNGTAESATSIPAVGSTEYFVNITNPLNGCAKNDSVTIVVDPTTVAGTLSVDNAVGCAGANSGTLTLAGNVGTVQGWEKATLNATTNTWSGFTPVANTTSTLSYTNLGSTTRYRVNVKSGNCNVVTSNEVTVEITDIPSGHLTVATCGATGADLQVAVLGMASQYPGGYSGTLSDGTTFSGTTSPITVSTSTTGSAITITGLTATYGGCSATTGFTGSVTLSTYYADADGDTYGNNSMTSVCNSAPVGYVANNTDCNDNAATTYPNAFETCNNGIDENCDGADEICAGDAFSTPIVVNTINNFGTGVQYTSTVNLGTATNSIQSPGLGNDVWYKFTASSNAVRIALTGNATAADNNNLMLFNDPGNANVSTQLIPIASENDVAPGNVGTLNADGGSETLLFDQLTIGTSYYLCVQNVVVPSTCSLTIGWLRGSSADILPYTNNTGIYTNTCQNFKATFRANATGYTVNRWSTASDLTNGATPNFTYAIPTTTGTTATTICQLGRLVSANLGTAPVTYYVSVDVTYSLKDAYGNSTAINALGSTMSSFVLSPEADLNVRTTDRCPVYKSATSGSIATNRSVCGTNRYEWSLAQTLPTPALPIAVLGGVGGSRILGMSAIPGIAAGQTYNVQIRSKHFDGVTNTNYGTAACVRTLGTAGMPTVEDGGVIAERSENGVTTSIYPNPNNGQSVNFAVSGMEGEMNVHIADATGRMVYANRYIVEGSLNTTIDFGQTLAGGVYMVEMIQNGEMKTMRMVVSK